MKRERGIRRVRPWHRREHRGSLTAAAWTDRSLDGPHKGRRTDICVCSPFWLRPPSFPPFPPSFLHLSHLIPLLPVIRALWSGQRSRIRVGPAGSLTCGEELGKRIRQGITRRTPPPPPPLSHLCQWHCVTSKRLVIMYRDNVHLEIPKISEKYRVLN